MCSRFRIREAGRAAATVVIVAAIGACGKADEPVAPRAPSDASSTQESPTSRLFVGNGAPPEESPLAAKYANDDAARAEGARLFDRYNCSGCHFHGAGGIGPSLMDNDWIYGGSVSQIYASIYQGRPNGMPSWGTKLASADIWKIAAYVHSLPQSNPAGAAAEPTTPPPPVPDDAAATPDRAAPAPKGASR